jgi:hypothetical protein
MKELQKYMNAKMIFKVLTFCLVGKAFVEGNVGKIVLV